MMKILNKLRILVLSMCLLGLASCSEMDDYKEFIEGGEIAYTEKMDSLQVFPGRNRVKIQGIIDADPKVSEFRVYWNSRKDSVVIPVERTQGVDTLATIIEGLPENIYNFEIRTFDDFGNKSVPVFATGEVYGERYQSSLINRPVTANTLIGNNLTISYAGMDRTSGVIGTEVEYTNVNAEEETKFVPIDSSHVFIENFQGGNEYQYRTVFVPEPTAIDTFYSEYDFYTPQFQISEPPYFQNASYPFEKAEWDGNRWGTPAGWTHNNAALSHNGYGALDNQIFDIEAGWGQPAINNGKVYQTFVLAPGTYAYIINVRELNYEAIDTKDQAYFVVAEGGSLPDVTDIESSSSTLAYERISKENGLHRTLLFTITEVTQVSVGIGATLPDAGVGRYLKINSFALGEVAEPPYLENAAVPFEVAERNGRWGTLAGWTTNDAAKNHNGVGGWDEWNGNIFNLESGWGAPPINNGKIYQTLILAPGSYTFKTNFRIVDGNINTNHVEADEGAAYLVVARGDNLPDVSDVETSSSTLGFEQVIAGKDPDAFEISFTLEEYTQVSVGFATTQADGSPGRFANIISFELSEN